VWYLEMKLFIFISYVPTSPIVNIYGGRRNVSIKQFSATPPMLLKPLSFAFLLEINQQLFDAISHKVQEPSRERCPCHGLDKLWKWNVVCFGMFVMNPGALMAVKKLYIRLCAARDSPKLHSPPMFHFAQSSD
jgi:hypothetical protein